MSPSSKRVLLDTNLLLLWLVGQTDPRLLSTFKRVQLFNPSDVELLRRQLIPFREQVTTPHVLSETSNFINQSPRAYRPALLDRFRVFVQEVAEIYEPAMKLIESEDFYALGLTDMAVLDLGKRVVVLTMDHRLAGKVTAIGGTSINFNHYRSSELLTEP